MLLQKINNSCGYLRKDGKLGIRNLVIVVYLVECAHHVAREVVNHFPGQPVQLIGFGGCYPNEYADKMMNALCMHANVGAVLLLSLGCESFNRNKLYENIASTNRPVKVIGIQNSGGTMNSIEEGIEFVHTALNTLRYVPLKPFSIQDLIVGVVCGGSDATSGISANPSVGKAFDLIVKNGGTAVFENTSEMIGLEEIIAKRAVNKELGDAIKKAIAKAAQYHTIMGHGSFAPGNADGGLTTMEEKSVGAYFKTGSELIEALIRPTDPISKPGLYLMDIVPDGEPRFGFPNPNDSSEIAELIASGAHCVLFTTGRGSVVGSAISPVIKICANPDTYSRMKDDMDINAGRIFTQDCSTNDIGMEIFQKIIAVVNGEKSSSERLGHQEFVLGYKSFTAGYGCLPNR